MSTLIYVNQPGSAIFIVYHLLSASFILILGIKLYLVTFIVAAPRNFMVLQSTKSGFFRKLSIPSTL